MKNILITALMLLTFCSCSSFLEEYSRDLARVETVADLDELLLGSAYHAAGKFYIQNSTLYTEGDPFNIFTHFMSDELQQNTTNNSFSTGLPLFGFHAWQRQVGIDVQGSSVGTENAFWKLCYKYINATNMIIEELKEVRASNDTEASDKIRIEGEARFLRALYYFTLVNLYAEPYNPSKAAATQGIPLKLTSHVEDKDYACGSLTEVYGQIIDDLQTAEACLKQTKRKSLYRADLTATYHLMSRVYLYMQDYANARVYAQHVLDRNDALADLNTFTGSDNIFTSQSPEAIFSMGGHFLTQYMYGDDRYIDQYPFYISEDLVNAFDDNDLRKSLYISRTDYGYTFKKIYWGRAHYGQACSVSDNFLFRTSEAYLNLAEAAALDDDEGTARRVLGELMAKRFAAPTTISESGSALVALIREERQRELCLEGHRWADLRRYTVCGKYPWSKTYRHAWAEFTYNYSTWGYERTRLRVYELEANDKAYTLAFPKEVIEFQNSISTNNRPERAPVETITNQ